VTGWLGGYNFQWAWASGVAAGKAAAAATGTAPAQPPRAECAGIPDKEKPAGLL
jgi:hypothetical protein